eukprot:scaffold8982_cov125-Isochrysis_galbana.AAC.5
MRCEGCSQRRRGRPSGITRRQRSLASSAARHAGAPPGPRPPTPTILPVLLSCGVASDVCGVWPALAVALLVCQI